MRYILTLLILISGGAFTGCNTKDPYNLVSVGLLKGYTLTEGRGSDFYSAEIKKKDGLFIEFYLGRLPGLAATPAEKNKYKWFQEQSINGHPVYFALKEAEGETWLLVTFMKNGANFITKVSSPADVAEAMAMILTYKPTN